MLLFAAVPNYCQDRGLVKNNLNSNCVGSTERSRKNLCVEGVASPVSIFPVLKS